MKTFARSIAVFLIFLAGTVSVIHVDRQCQMMNAGDGGFLEKVENFIENQG